MRYRVLNIPLWLDEDEALLASRAAERLGVGAGGLRNLFVVRRSLDARRKGHPRWLLNVEVDLEGALVGAPVPDLERPVAMSHVVKSFDPCLFCTVH